MFADLTLYLSCTVIGKASFNCPPKREIGLKSVISLESTWTQAPPERDTVFDKIGPDTAIDNTQLETLFDHVGRSELLTPRASWCFESQCLDNALIPKCDLDGRLQSWVLRLPPRICRMCRERSLSTTLRPKSKMCKTYPLCMWERTPPKSSWEQTICNAQAGQSCNLGLVCNIHCVAPWSAHSTHLCRKSCFDQIFFADFG